MAVSPWATAAIQLRLNYHGLDDGDVAKFSAERSGLYLSVTCRPEHEHFRWNVVIVHERFPRGVQLVGRDAPEAANKHAELITGDENFDRAVRVLSGGAGLLSMFSADMRSKTRELFTETRARIARARIEFSAGTPSPAPGPLKKYIELGLYIGRRLARPMTLAGLLENYLHDPDAAVRNTNYRMLMKIDPEILSGRPPAEAADVAGRISLLETTEGALSEIENAGALSKTDS